MTPLRATLAALVGAMLAALPPAAARADVPGGSAQIGNCRVYAGDSAWGAACVTGGHVSTVRELLHGDSFQACRWDHPPEDYLVPPAPPGSQGHWWLRTCLPADLDIDQPVPPGIVVVVDLHWIVGEPPPLTPNQDLVWNLVQGTYPTPLVGIGPTPRPRVNSPTFYWYADQSEETQFSNHQTMLRTARNAAGQRIQVRARMIQLDVTPDGLGAPDRRVLCPAGGVEYDVNTPPDQQSLRSCRDVFVRSSASQPDGRYFFGATAHWEVSYRVDGGAWTDLGGTTTTSAFRLPVRETQSNAVPLE